MSTDEQQFPVSYHRDPSHTLIDGHRVLGVLCFLAVGVILFYFYRPENLLLAGVFLSLGIYWFYDRWRKKGGSANFEGTLWREEGRVFLHGPDPLQEQESDRKLELEESVVQSRGSDGVVLKARSKGAFGGSLDAAPLIVRFSSEDENEQEAFVRACSGSEEENA
jgi:hypothetical protein